MARQQTEIKVPRETTGGRMLIERLAVGRGSLPPSSIVKRGERKVGTRGRWVQGIITQWSRLC